MDSTGRRVSTSISKIFASRFKPSLHCCPSLSQSCSDWLTRGGHRLWRAGTSSSLAHSMLRLDWPIIGFVGLLRAFISSFKFSVMSTFILASSANTLSFFPGQSHINCMLAPELTANRVINLWRTSPSLVTTLTSSKRNRVAFAGLDRCLLLFEGGLLSKWAPLPLADWQVFHRLIGVSDLAA